jgi:hypothetical protein
VVVLKVTKILRGSNKFEVEGEVVSAFGFEDEDLRTKDYGPLLKG